MFRDTVITAINDVFDHLGQEVTIRSRNGETKQVIAVIKQPENPYELGDSQIVEQVAEVSIKSSDDRRYKIFEEPLMDGITQMWKFNAVLIGE